eukprot:gene23201-35550_t
MAARLLVEIMVASGLLMFAMRPSTCSVCVCPTAPACPDDPKVTTPEPRPVASNESQAAASQAEATQAAASSLPPLSTEAVREDLRICSRLPADKIVIRKSELMQYSGKRDFRHLDICCHREKDVDDMKRKHLFNIVGKEHYPLLRWLSNDFSKQQGSQLFVELGTREGASAVAFADGIYSSLYSIDVADTVGHVKKTLSAHTSKEVTNDDLQMTAQNIHFIRSFILDESKPGSAAWRRMILGSRAMLLDTLHLPESRPFEYDFMK